MISIRLTFQPGISVCEQAVYAVKRAVVAGKLRPVTHSLRCECSAKN
jgi:hypothetical protein